jgi:hypothetical protein
MKYIKRFNVLNEFNNFIFDDTNTPNVSLIEELEQPENLAFISLMIYNYANDYLTFIPVEDSTFGFSKAGLSYSLDNGSTWAELAANGTTPTITAGSKILWKNSTTLTPTFGGIGMFSSSKAFDAQGNVMSLYYGDNFAGQASLGGKDYAFNKLFYNSNVRNAEKLVLPATTLEFSCYNQMFYGCTSLTTAPALPAATLANSCYGQMFQSCTSLTTAPALPATTLEFSCYNQMFYGCTSLITAPALPATTLASSCYEGMFNGCTSLTTAPELPATTLASDCYLNIFSGCTSLTTAPALPAATLASSCYYMMFNGCTSLTSAPELPATTLASSCYKGMFNGCTSLTTAPALPATTLASDCYNQMFYGCRHLNYVKMLATNISASNCLKNWLTNVSTSGTFVKAEGTTIPSSTSGIPNGWTVETV